MLEHLSIRDVTGRLRQPVSLVTAGMLVAGALSLPKPIPGADVADGWHNLQEVTRDREYTMILRDGGCARGLFVLVDDQGVVLRASAGRNFSIKRADVLRVSDLSAAPADRAIFSGRSSWADVKTAIPRGTEYFSVVTNRGAKLKWKQPTFSDDSATSSGNTVAKADIRYVSFVRYKPLTKNEEFYETEGGGLFAPRLWFNGLMLGKISVLLYNSEIPEDNSAPGCH